MASDITDVMRELVSSAKPSKRDTLIAALAAATADGPLVEDVPCPTCGTGWAQTPQHFLCPDCHGTGTVRIVAHRADPALAERLLAMTCPAGLPYTGDDPGAYHGHTDCWVLRAAARIIGGES